MKISCNVKRWDEYIAGIVNIGVARPSKPMHYFKTGVKVQPKFAFLANNFYVDNFYNYMIAMNIAAPLPYSNENVSVTFVSIIFISYCRIISFRFLYFLNFNSIKKD